jgi:hypothetical protein
LFLCMLCTSLRAGNICLFLQVHKKAARLLWLVCCLEILILWPYSDSYGNWFFKCFLLENILKLFLILVQFKNIKKNNLRQNKIKIFKNFSWKADPNTIDDCSSTRAFLHRMYVTKAFTPGGCWWPNHGVPDAAGPNMNPGYSQHFEQ